MLLILATLTLGFSSCSKSPIAAADDTETASAQNLAVADIEDDNLQVMADQAQSEGTVSDLRTSQPVNNSSIDLITSCAVITRDTLSTPKKITIDFGAGCTNANGVTRKGKIIITYTGAYRAEGTVVHIVSDNYYVNDNKIDIDRTLTNTGRNDHHNSVFAVHAVRTITFPDGSTSTSTFDKTREWIAGENTPRDFTDDVYRVIGTGTHTSRKGILYDDSTITPLIRNVSCHEFVSGDVKIIRHGERDRFAIIDFGTGECDDVATVTLDNGKSKTIDLKH